MATSSIFANFDITEKKKSLDFAKALVKSETDAFAQRTNPSGRMLRNAEEIRSFFGKNDKKKVSQAIVQPIVVNLL